MRLHAAADEVPPTVSATMAASVAKYASEVEPDNRAPPTVVVERQKDRTTLLVKENKDLVVSILKKQSVLPM